MKSPARQLSKTNLSTKIQKFGKAKRVYHKQHIEPCSPESGNETLLRDRLVDSYTEKKNTFSACSQSPLVLSPLLYPRSFCANLSEFNVLTTSTFTITLWAFSHSRWSFEKP